MSLLRPLRPLADRWCVCLPAPHSLLLLLGSSSPYYTGCFLACSRASPDMAPRQQLPSAEQLAPRPGDRILRFRRCWLDMVLSGRKTAEIRFGATTPGGAWLGCEGRVWGRVHIGDPVHLLSLDDMRARYDDHRVDVPSCRTGLEPFFGPCPSYTSYLNRLNSTIARGR